MPALHPRTPKLLAPLDSRPKNIAALPVLKHHAPLKPISRSPLCSRTRLRRERLSWGSPRTGPLTTKGGSEESGSSSSSSQSSIDLEDEDEEDERDAHARASGEKSHLKFFGDRLLQHSNGVSSTEADLVGETRQHFTVQSSHIPPIHRSSHNLDREPISHTMDPLSTEKAINSHYEGKATDINHTKEPADSQSLIKCNYAQRGDTMNHTKDTLNNEITSKSGEEPETEISHGITFNMNNEQGDAIACSEGNYNNDLCIKQTRRTMKDSCCEETRVHNTVPRREDVKLNTSTTEERTQLFTPTVNLPQSDMDPKRDERMAKALKPVRNKERRTSMNCELRASIQTNQQSFNILAHKDRSILNWNKSKSHVKYSSLSTQVKDKTRKSPEIILSEETVTKVKSKLKSVKGAHCNTSTPSPRKKVTDHAQSKRTNPDKLNSNRAQQHPPVRELKSTRQLKRPGLAGTQRSKSAVDFITYKDMFQPIQSGVEGPAIYEMFAGPIYDNLRVSSSCEKVKDRQVQSAPSRKMQQRHKVKHRPLKQAQSKLKRCPGESIVVSAKSKPKLAPSSVKPHLTPVSRKGTQKMKDIMDRHTEAELVLSKDVDICYNSAQEKTEDHLSSITEEAFSRSETLKSDDKTLTTQATSPHAEDYSHMHVNMEERNGNSSIGNPKQPVPEPVLSQSPQQPKIDTWTSSSSSSHTIMSPVYQKFLDEVGDGPLTDDLLQCLAEELISLDERDVSIGPCPENLEPSTEESNRQGEPVSGRNTFPEVNCLIRIMVKSNKSVHCHHHSIIWSLLSTYLITI